MTDKERQELIEQMRRHDPWPCWPRVFEKAADEIERLAAENAELTKRLLQYVGENNAEFFYASFPDKLAADLKQVEAENEHHIHLAFIDAGTNPARTWKEEAERLAKENERLTERVQDLLIVPRMRPATY